MRVEGSGGRDECGYVWKTAVHDWRCGGLFASIPGLGDNITRSLRNRSI